MLNLTHMCIYICHPKLAKVTQNTKLSPNFIFKVQLPTLGVVELRGNPIEKLFLGLSQVYTCILPRCNFVLYSVTKSRALRKNSRAPSSWKYAARSSVSTCMSGNVLLAVKLSFKEIHYISHICSET